MSKTRKKANSVKKTRRSYEQLFLDKLKELSEVGKEFVPNSALQQALGWDDDRYKRIKTQLQGKNLIYVGRGQGGTVALSSSSQNGPLKVFVSYSHADEAIKNQLMKHLKPLERLKLISLWHDRKLSAGDNFPEIIDKKLDDSDIVLLLVSVDFLNSEYCYSVELEQALDLHDKKKCKVVPIILRGCLWHSSSFGKLIALPSDGKAVTTWPNLDDVLASVAHSIEALAKEILAEKY